MTMSSSLPPKTTSSPCWPSSTSLPSSPWIRSSPLPVLVVVLIAVKTTERWPAGRSSGASGGRLSFERKKPPTACTRPWSPKTRSSPLPAWTSSPPPPPKIRSPEVPPKIRSAAPLAKTSLAAESMKPVVSSLSLAVYGNCRFDAFAVA